MTTENKVTTLRQIWFQNLAFLLPFFLLLLAIGILQVLYTQGAILMWVNQQNNLVADVFFKYATHLGDGFLCAMAGLSFLLFSYRKGITVLLTYALPGILSSIIKSLANVPRPAAYFEKSLYLLHRVDGVVWYYNHSFPSGHTTSAFALYFLLAVWSKNNVAKFSCLLLALAVGYSRMYLLQHFLIDVTFGALLGTAGSFLVYFGLEKYWYQNPKSWLDKSALRP